MSADTYSPVGMSEYPKLSIHTTFYNSFFLLRTAVIINDKQAIVGADKNGWLTLNCQYPAVGVTFDSLVTDVNDILQRHGMEPVSNYWCEEMPLFEVKISSKQDLKKLIYLEKDIKKGLASKIAAKLTAHAHSPDASILPPYPSTALDFCIHVHPQVYLLIPDSSNKDGNVIKVTKDNIELCMNLCAKSNVFDFGNLFKAFRDNPERLDEGMKTVSF